MNVNALLLEGHLDAAADLLVDNREEPVHSLDDCYVIAEISIDSCELDSDNASADDDEFRDLLCAHVEELSAVDNSRKI